MSNKNYEVVKNPIRRSLFSPFFRHIPSLFEEDGFGEENFETVASSNVSLSEDNEHVYVEANLPGLKEEEIEIVFHEGVLWIKGESKKTEENNERKYYCKASRAFSYRITLPNNLNENENPKAQFRDGVIVITFNKLKKELPKKITISK